MDLITSAWLLITGASIGLIVGLTSIGSGSLLTPTLELDFSSVVAGAAVVGTATLYGTITKLVASGHNYMKNRLDSGYAFIIAVTGVPTAAIGAFFTRPLIASDLFQPLLAVILVVAALSILFDVRIRNREIRKDPELTLGLRLKGAAVGAVVGIVAGMTGVSTGTLLVAALILVLEFRTHTAVTLAIFEGGLVLLAALVVQLYLGNVNIPVSALLIVGGIPGIIAGNHYKYRVNGRMLSYGVAGVIIFESARTISQFLWGKRFFAV